MSTSKAPLCNNVSSTKVNKARCVRLISDPDRRQCSADERVSERGRKAVELEVCVLCVASRIGISLSSELKKEVTGHNKATLRKQMYIAENEPLSPRGHPAQPRCSAGDASPPGASVKISAADLQQIPSHSQMKVCYRKATVLTERCTCVPSCGGRLTSIVPGINCDQSARGTGV
ncbi:hypothetical protein JOB18_008286 [Solea senegalensis]|uniref:Uncharacterized protein n=1 Tax=Solea senegalensis TaxID=28829 RepID=A0AAV6R978_SOLSE|nr:hypothetical protein JOB18_008286 [Solea senegalensis]